MLEHIGKIVEAALALFGTAKFLHELHELGHYLFKLSAKLLK